MRGGPGRDDGTGLAGDDFIYAGPGNDTQFDGGLSGHDLVSGGAGNDRCIATIDGRGDDIALGGPGEDTSYTDPGDERLAFEDERPCFAE
jgi:Ca2+-binding RTX toxin-like protein